MNDTLIKYIRKNNIPIACLVAIKINEEVRIGFSKYSNKEEKVFNKETAKKLALSRARNSHLYTIHKEWNYKRNAFSYIPVANFPESLSGEMKIFVDRVMKYFRVDEIDNAYVEKEHEKRLHDGGVVNLGSSSFYTLRKELVSFRECLESKSKFKAR